ncbi:hypothetical protein Hanom_Chr12g01114441 [Helianthus anomalus]
MKVHEKHLKSIIDSANDQKKTIDAIISSILATLKDLLQYKNGCELLYRFFSFLVQI